MSKRFRPWKIDEPQFLPATVRDFVAKDQLARFIVSLVTEELDLTEVMPVTSARRANRRSIPR